ncbi:MAG: DUF433 domain-containing protein [Acidobacteria bacterium]|nr:DUF433 domain-containing protein [Acidobacteriota bacterium]
MVNEEVNGVAMAYYPLGKYVVIQPNVQSGLPTIKHTRVTAGAVAGRLRRGKAAQQVARDFGIPLAAVKEAARLAAEYDYERSYA